MKAASKITAAALIPKVIVLLLLPVDEGFPV